LSRPGEHARRSPRYVSAPRHHLSGVPMIAIIGNVVTGLAALTLFRATLTLRKR
jgi:hypothetical protein